MAMTSCIPRSAKLAFLSGTFLPGHNYYIALYLGQSYGPTTTAYQTSGEVANGSGYTTGGQLLTGYGSGSDTNGAWITFTNPVWSGASFSADGAIIYDASVAGNPAVAVLTFGSTQTVSSGTFTVQMPSPASGTNAIITGD
jgi:hypothetical protein